MPNKRRRDKTSAEFGESMKHLLGRKADRKSKDYSSFKNSLMELAN